MKFLKPEKWPNGSESLDLSKSKNCSLILECVLELMSPKGRNRNEPYKSKKGERPMKILVFDDNEANRITAEATLKGHELTIVGTYDEAQSMLASNTDHRKVEEILEEIFGDFNPYRTEDTDKKEAYFKARTEVLEMYTSHPDFEVVMTDLMVPASSQHLGNPQLGGQERELGAIIALFAIFQGVKNVLVASDMNHHDHPASAALDCFHKCRAELKLKCINNLPMVWIDAVTHEIVTDKFLQTKEGEEKYPGKWDCRKGLIKGKHWGQLMEWLMK